MLRDFKTKAAAAQFLSQCGYQFDREATEQANYPGCMIFRGKGTKAEIQICRSGRVVIKIA